METLTSAFVALLIEAPTRENRTTNESVVIGIEIYILTGFLFNVDKSQNQSDFTHFTHKGNFKQ